MQEFSGRIFHTLEDREGSLVLRDMAFDDCDFYNCDLCWMNYDLRSRLRSLRPFTRRRSLVQNMRLTRSRLHHCWVGPAVFRDAEVRDLSSDDLLIFWGSVFERVVLKGRICNLKINTVPTSDAGSAVCAALDRDRERFYARCDWALDIREARLREFDCLGIPPALIRIDGDTQAVLSRSRIAARREELRQENHWWPYIDHLLSSGEAAMVIAAPLAMSKRHRDRSLADLKELRALGMVEP